VLEVSKAVRMKGVEAPDGDTSFVALDQERRGQVKPATRPSCRTVAPHLCFHTPLPTTMAHESRFLPQVDEDGLPVVYDKDLIEAYWKKEGSALQQRWTEFLGYSVPYLTRMVGMLITGTPLPISLSPFARVAICRVDNRSLLSLSLAHSHAHTALHGTAPGGSPPSLHRQRMPIATLSLSLSLSRGLSGGTHPGGTDELMKNDRVLAKDAREIFEKLGPTYIKMGQMMSVRPDVLPQAALDELSILQVRARWVTLRARWVTLRACWLTLRARWVSLRARWVTLRARWVTLRARWLTLRACWLTLRARWLTLRARRVTLRARWLPLRARRVTLRARRVTLRARWVTLRARWVTLRARWVTLRARWVTLRARWVTLRARWVTLRARWVTLRARWVTLRARASHSRAAHTHTSASCVSHPRGGL
jgi:hypothetical protein